MRALKFMSNIGGGYEKGEGSDVVLERLVRG